MSILEQFLKIKTNHGEEITAMRNATQVKLAKDMNVDLGVWIDMGYAKKFDEVIKANPTILEDLLDRASHDETFEEVKVMIYH